MSKEKKENVIVNEDCIVEPIKKPRSIHFSAGWIARHDPEEFERQERKMAKIFGEPANNYDL